MIWVTQRRRKSGFCSGRASATPRLRAVARLIRASRSTWLPSPRNPAQSPRNRLAVGSLTTGVPESPRKKSGRRCRIGAEVFVVRVSGRPRGAPQRDKLSEEETATMKLTTITMVSVDGVMQGLGGRDEDRRGGFERGGWVAPVFDNEAMAFLNQVYQRADAFLFG